MPCSRTQHSDAGHAQNQAFLPGGGGGGGGGGFWPNCQKTAFSFLVLNLFYSFTMVYFK